MFNKIKDFFTKRFQKKQEREKIFGKPKMKEIRHVNKRVFKRYKCLPGCFGSPKWFFDKKRGIVLKNERLIIQRLKSRGILKYT